MAFVPTTQKSKPTQSTPGESLLHSELSIYHPTAEEHPETDKATSSVPSAKKYLLWLLVGIAVFVLLLVCILK